MSRIGSIRRSVLAAGLISGLAYSQDAPPVAAAAPAAEAAPVVDPIAEQVSAKLAEALQHTKANQPNEAIAAYSEVLKLKSDMPHVYLERGKLYNAGKEFAKAIADFTTALKAKPDLDIYAHRCSAYVQTGALQDAIADCTKALEKNPKNGAATYARAVAYLAAKQPEKALPDLEKTVELSPDHTEAHFQIAEMALAKDDPLRAMREYTIVLQQRPGWASAYSRRAAAKESVGDYRGAAEDRSRIK